MTRLVVLLFPINMLSPQELRDIRGGFNQTEPEQIILLIAESTTDATAIADSTLTHTATPPIKAGSQMQAATNAAETVL